MLDVLVVVLEVSLLLTIGWWVILAFSAAIIQVLIVTKPKEIWVRHCLPTKDVTSILTKGFNRGTSELDYQRRNNLSEAEMIICGQGGQDKVSFSTLLDGAFKKMVAKRTGKDDTTTYLYLKLPVSLLDTSINIVMWDGVFFKEYLGVGIEYTIDREIVNEAIKDPTKIALDKPKGFVSLWTVATLFSSWFGLLDKVIKSYVALFRGLVKG